ncbi:MAG: HEAT repeat domain-containing protein [Candidatus Hydrogenedentes bacterium]|nr:HEAT repeat domain-containing protein [Candidatus Hydrogenedentota bacterium]
MRLSFVTSTTSGGYPGHETVFACAGRILCVLIVIVAACGCGSGGSQAPATTDDRGEAANPQALLDEWKGLIADPEANLSNPRLAALTSMLAVQAPGLLNVMVDMLVDPATKPQSKLMILSSLEVALDPALVPRLLQLTEPGVDPVVRSGVTMLLANARTPEVGQRLDELSRDEDSRVRLAALNGMVLQGDAEARDTLRAWYLEAGTPQPFRERIALTLGLQPVRGDSPVLAMALKDTAIDPGTRMIIAGALSALGDPEAVQALKDCAESDAPEDLKTLARDALAATESRQTLPYEPPGAVNAIQLPVVVNGNG